MRRSAFALLLVLGLVAVALWRRTAVPAKPAPAPAVAIAAPAIAPVAIPAPIPAVAAAPAPTAPLPEQARKPMFPMGSQAFVEPDPVRDAAFARFDIWAKTFRAAPTAEAKAALEKEGIALAQSRRDQLSDLIETDPERAIGLRVPLSVRRELPESVSSLLEQRVSGRGSLSVLGAIAAPDAEVPVKPIFRKVAIGDATYEAFVYGRRLGEPTLPDVSIHGIALGGKLAVSEDAVRILEPVEAAEAKAAIKDPVCAVTSLAITPAQQETVVEANGVPLLLCNPEHSDVLNTRYVQASAETIASRVTAEGSIQAASAWTEGTKKVILIRVDFSDLAGAPFADTTGTNLIKDLNTFYRESSFNKSGFAPAGSGSAVTATFRMPSTASHYGTNNLYDELRADARKAATSAGFNMASFDRDVICIGNVPGFGWAGLGYVGGAGAWLRSAFDAGVAGHELGHNMGLNHANFWDTAGQSVIGPGTNVEYGDKFDTMGSAAAGAKHFNARNKNYLNWLAAADVKTFTTNGVYVINPHDLTNATGIRGLKIAMNTSTNYWVEFRQKYVSNKWLMNGVGLRWAESTGNKQSLLLDTTPGTPDGKDDSAIVVGRTFSDYKAGIHITALRKRGTTPESIEVAVNKGAFATNVAPVVTVTSSSSVIASTGTATFTAAATDANGDTLAYYWDFGDGNFGENTNVISHKWSTNAHMQVRCVVTDMKGGTASDSVVVKVGAPTTRLITGRVLNDGKPLAGVYVSASSTKGGYTDTDGSYSIVGVTSGTYTLDAKLNGFEFVHPGFANPLSVTVDKANIDFFGIPSAGLATTSIVAEGSVWKYLDNGSNQGTAWRNVGFSDIAWKQGPAILGYGDNDVTTTLQFGADPNNKFITTYFRRVFTVSNQPSDFTKLTLGIMRDDGAVVYLNGKEVYRSNMPTGTILYNTLASASIGGADETAFNETDLPASSLLVGDNLLAVEIHQAGGTSSDIGFDLRLLGFSTLDQAQPAVSAEVSGTAMQITWPPTATGWSLYANPDLSNPNGWKPATPAAVFKNGEWNYSAQTSGTQQYYRLQKP